MAFNIWVSSGTRTGATGRACALLLSVCATLVAATPALAAQSIEEQVLKRLAQLERRQSDLEQQLETRDARIRELELKLARGGHVSDSVASAAQTTYDGNPAREQAPIQVTGSREEESYGLFQPAGAGFKLADTPYGDVNFSAWAYIRYLNQTSLDSTYTDSFGRTSVLDLRNDVQVNKVNLYFRGWVFRPEFHYNLELDHQHEPGGACSGRHNR